MTSDATRRSPVAAETARAAAVSALSVVLAVLTITPRRGPVVAPDEMGYLAGARAIAGAGEPIDMARLPYYPIGWPVLAAIPARIFSGDAGATYTATIIVQLILLATMAATSMLVARSVLRADAASASIAAAVAATVPSVVVTTRFAWSETFLAWLVCLSALLTFATYRAAFAHDPVRRRSIAMAGIAGAVVGWMPFSHGRLLLGSACLFAVTVVVLALRRRRAMVIAFVGGGFGAAGAGWFLTSIVQSRVWDGEVPSNLAKAQQGFSSVAAIWQTVQVAGGHVWTFLIGSLGFGAVAMWVAAESFRRRPADAGRRPLQRMLATPERAFAIASVSVFVSTLIADAAFFSGSVFDNGSNRQDHFLYGRYLDVFQPLAITFGLTACLMAVRRGATRRVLTLGVVAACSLLVSYAFVEVVGDNELNDAGPFNPFTTLNLARFEDAVARATVETLVALGVSIGLMVAAAALVGRRPLRPLGLTVALAGCTMLLLGSNLVRWHDAREATDGVDYRDARAVAGHLESVGASYVAFDGSIWVGDRLYLEFWLPDLVAERVSLPVEIDCRGTTAVVTHAETASPELIAGRLAVVRCDEPGASSLVEPADVP